MSIGAVVVSSFLVGKRFGKLIVMQEDFSKINSRSFSLCKCDCGNDAIVRTDGLKSGHTTSCGCKNKKRFETVGNNRKKPVGESSFNMFYQSYINSAKKRNINFELTKEEFKKITSSLCHYCGTPPYKEYKPRSYSNGSYYCNGVDRVNSSLGYTNDNCVPCCWVCNRAKSSSTEEEFLLWVKKVYEYNKEKFI